MRFLVIQLRQIGDVVLTTPIPRILKEARPGCGVTVLTERPSDQLLSGNPNIDEILINDRKGTWRDTLGLARELRRRRFDCVLDFMGNPRSALLAFASGAAQRISYRTRGRGILYTQQIDASDAPYAVQFKKRLLEGIGIRSEVDTPEIFLTAEERQRGMQMRADLLGGSDRRLVTVDPSHRRETRRWPAEYFGSVCRMLAENENVLPVVLWGPGEEELAEKVVGSSRGAAVKAPPTRLREMAGLIASADAHLGNCSAPRHIAVAVGTPTFTVLGSTSYGWTHPAPEHCDASLGMECQPCNSNRCDRDRACLIGFSAEQVYLSLDQWCREVLGWHRC